MASLSVTTLIWLVGIHSIIHGIWGIILVQTSHYVNYTPGINYTLVVLYALLVVLGVMVFCVMVSRVPACAVVFGVLFAVLALAIIIASIVYSAKYWPFFANSAFDAMLLYTDVDCWICNDHAMTIWHFLTLLMIFLMFLWFLYALLLCKYARCVCCIPCPSRSCYKPPKCPNVEQNPCCRKENFFKRLFRPKCVPPPPVCPTYPTPPSPPVCRHNVQQQICPLSYGPQNFQPGQAEYQPHMMEPNPRKGHKFVMSLRPGRYCK